MTDAAGRVGPRKEFTPGRGHQGATHPEWMFAWGRAALYRGGRPFSPNFYPFASDLQAWMQRKRTGIVLTHAEGSDPSYTNPYTHSASRLSAQIGSLINEAFDFWSSSAEMDRTDAAIKWQRLRGEFLMTAVRFCESSVKQMLYCTAIPEKIYKRASLGQLIASDCRSCRKTGHPHDTSMIGALAHHYFACLEFDGCAFDHLALLNRRRSKEAAHADSPGYSVGTVDSSREALKSDFDAIGNDLVHMADHLGKIERLMLREIEAYISASPYAPSIEVLSRIPVRMSREVHAKLIASQAPSSGASGDGS